MVFGRKQKLAPMALPLWTQPFWSDGWYHSSLSLSLPARGWLLSHSVHRPSDIQLLCSPCGSCFPYTLCRCPGHHLRFVLAFLRGETPQGERCKWGEPQAQEHVIRSIVLWDWRGCCGRRRVLVKINKGRSLTSLSQLKVGVGHVTGEAMREVHDVGRGP